MSTSHPIYVQRALAELAEALLRNEYSKDLHNIPMLRALAKEDDTEFKRLWVERYDCPWEKTS